MDALALAVVPRGSTASRCRRPWSAEQGDGVRGLRVSFAVGTSAHSYASVRARPCGAGCYRAERRASSAARATCGCGSRDRRARRPGTCKLPDDLARRRRERDRRSCDAGLEEPAHAELPRSTRLRSPPTSWSPTGRSSRPIASPTRSTRAARRSSSACDRWDRPSQTSGQPGRPARRSDSHQPQPFWVTATDAHVLGTRTLRRASRSGTSRSTTPARRLVPASRSTGRRCARSTST